MSRQTLTTARLLTATLLASSLVLPSLGFAQGMDRMQHKPGDQRMAPATPPAGTMPPMMPMMPMMQSMMSQMMAGHGMGSMHALMRDRTEGFLALVKTELQITDAQAAPWNAFADAVRAGAKKLREEGKMAPMADSTWPDKIAAHEKSLSAHLDMVRSVRAPASALYAVLTAEQKKTADALMAGGGMGMHR